MVITTTPSKRKKPGRSKRPANSTWQDQTVAEPRPGLPQGTADRRAAWLRRYIVIAAIGFLPVLAFAGLAFASTLTGPTPANDQNVTWLDANTEQARALAMTTVGTWMNQDPSPLPGGKVITWNGYKAVPALAKPTSSSANKAPEDQLQVHSLTVSAGDAFYTAQVQIAVSPTSGARLIGTPAIVPDAPAAQDYTGTPWPGAQEAHISDDAAEAVTQWASTFIGGTPTKLRLAVGDPDTGHTYMPVLGAHLISASIDYVSVQADQIDADGKVPDKPAQAIARVTLTITWGDPAAEQDAAHAPAKLTYDVLIDGASTASPRVLAWGGPGTGPDLTAFANAITGRKVDLQEPATPAPTPDDAATTDAPAPEQPAEPDPAQAPVGDGQ